ncbi:hypothetical protein A9Q99_02540 [Gammaproteobacteria bacterium 45_16_T64]|nr:hypothetical protein A9Q99_02540 [Gammaproteobacteria bacterium 45_16_T64]
MKIAIIGGGFYGCCMANSLKRLHGANIQIDIFDRSESLLSRAATNNQSRLHLGFHYPRSTETIAQTIAGVSSFVEEFGACIDYPKNNLYAVHRDGYVDFNEYMVAMDDHDLKYDVLPIENAPYFRNPSHIEGIIRVEEGVIRLADMASLILSKLDAKVYCSAIVTSVDPDRGVVTTGGKAYEGYDAIVNATYTDNNIGMPQEKRFELKFELAAMALVESPYGDDTALTIMDGPFVSLYPAGYGLSTLSSVTHTPFTSCSTVAELETRLLKVRESGVDNQVIENILAHGNNVLDLDLRFDDVKSVWVAPKAKFLHDLYDQRLADIRVHNKLISVMCGKLDAVHQTVDKVLKVLEDISNTSLVKV